jgi:two-component system, OmpR family, copper resistance phosphate regulon response regulator CusR
MRILFIEDEPKLRRNVVEGLTARGYTVDTAENGKEGERLAREQTYAVIVSDIMMPEQDGIETCRKIRTKGIVTPIILLTARDTLAEKITGLDVGADDYLTKPFSFDELTARIRALMRRQPTFTHDILTYHDLVLDTRTQHVTVGKKVLDLTLREYGILEYLLRNQGTVITREDILTHVWDRFFDSLSNVVDVHVKNLRKKLPPLYGKRLRTVWGKGYQLVE